MLQLDFSLSDEWNKNVDLNNLGQLSELDLRYGFLFGDLVFIINGVDCSTKWGWIPMIDLAIALRHICESLASQSLGVEVFEFTESNATITIKRDQEVVYLKTSYTPSLEFVLFSEFACAVNHFYNKVFRESVARFPLLEKHPTFKAFHNWKSDT